MPLALALLMPMIGAGTTQLPFEKLFAFASRLLIQAPASLIVMFAHRCLATILALTCMLLSGGCATPVGVERADPQSVHRELTGNVLSTGEVSQFTQNVLRLGGIAEIAEDDPEAALATLRQAVTAGVAGQNAMFAYAELAFKTRFGRWWPPILSGFGSLCLCLPLRWRSTSRAAPG
jgi:hypothetical protein